MDDSKVNKREHVWIRVQRRYARILVPENSRHYRRAPQDAPLVKRQRVDVAVGPETNVPVCPPGNGAVEMQSKYLQADMHTAAPIPAQTRVDPQMTSADGNPTNESSKPSPGRALDAPWGPDSCSSGQGGGEKADGSQSIGWAWRRFGR